MKNVDELTNVLIEIFEETKSDAMELAKTKELTNVAGKVLKGNALKLAYNQFKGYHDKKIKFLED